MTRSKKSKARAYRRSGRAANEKTLRCVMEHAPKWFKQMLLGDKIAHFLRAISKDATNE